MPYRYLEDIAIADVAFEAWGASLEEMFRAAAEAAMGAMIEDPRSLAEAETREVRIGRDALDLLLHAFLEEMVYYKDADRLFVLPSELSIREEEGGFELAGVLAGEEIDPARHEILTDVKAVTLHHLEVRRESPGWICRVILDV